MRACAAARSRCATPEDTPGQLHHHRAHQRHRDPEEPPGRRVGGEAAATLCIIYDMSYLEMTINIDELDINQINVGQPVTVTADSVNGTFDGVVTRVSMVGTTQGRHHHLSRHRPGGMSTATCAPGMNVNAGQSWWSRPPASSRCPTPPWSRGDIVLVTTESPSAANALADTPAPEGYVYVQVETGVSDPELHRDRQRPAGRGHHRLCLQQHLQL